MRVTKLEHAALVVEHSGNRLFIDPGKFTTPITEASGALAVVVTHQHDDHWTPEQLGRIRDRNPDVRVFGPAGMAEAAAEAGVEVERVVPVPGAVLRRSARRDPLVDPGHRQRRGAGE
jgi:L-ascorbate metabolism protein UlaG (beta-lactamase superfamily)